MKEKFFTDEELVAYLDAEQDHAPVREIELALASDPGLASRIEQLSIDRAQIAEAFSSIQAAPYQMPELQGKPVGFARFGMAGISTAAALVLGLVIGSFADFDRTPKWVSYVAAYQALYTTGTLSPVNLGEEQLRTELARVSSAIGKELKLEQLDVSGEIEYKRGQVLGFEGSPLIQLAFLTKTGEPIALCIIRNGVENSQKPKTASLEGMSSAVWSRDGYAYLLIGGRDQEMVSRLADKFIANNI